MQRSSRTTLLAALESKNGSKWIALYEDNRYPRPSYYCTTDNGGEALGEDRKAAAARVVELAKAIRPKVFVVEITPEVITRYT